VRPSNAIGEKAEKLLEKNSTRKKRLLTEIIEGIRIQRSKIPPKVVPKISNYKSSRV
jgi:hypothetical protein